MMLHDLLTEAEREDYEPSRLPWWLDPQNDDRGFLLTIAGMVFICIIVQIGIYFKWWLI